MRSNRFCYIMADDLILISFAQIWLRLLLINLASYCHSGSLMVKYDKSEVLLAFWRSISHSWSIGGHETEQVQCYRYINVTFMANKNWSAYLTITKIKDNKFEQRIFKF